MSKYDLSQNPFSNANGPCRILSFAQLEQRLGFKLPPSARRFRARGANELGRKAHVQCRAWLAWSYEVAAVNLSQQWVQFRPVGALK